MSIGQTGRTEITITVVVFNCFLRKNLKVLRSKSPFRCRRNPLYNQTRLIFCKDEKELLLKSEFHPCISALWLAHKNRACDRIVVGQNRLWLLSV